VFKRVSLSGSAELFRETARAPEILAETEPEPASAAIHHLPIQRQEIVSTYEYQLTEPQVRALIDAVQKIKYPHTLKNTAKLGMEEFEQLEALRQLLLEGLR
jgi:biotin synthase-like enzyme